LVALRQNAPPAVDVDDLEPVRVSDAPRRPPAPRANAPITNAIAFDGPGETFVFDETRNEWVRVRGTPRTAPSADSGQSPGIAPPATGRQPDQIDPRIPGADILESTEVIPGAAPAAYPMFAERVIEIDYQSLISGDSRLNIIIRPNDLIYVQPSDFGFVYVDGEIVRAGVYTLPGTGHLTASRLVAAAGGLNAIAIPERCDLIRRVGTNREATVRFNLAAIRRRTEPDFELKPDDHIIVGTNFWATPLAVIRNGFRVTYGWGFLLDRNFGNDVFGPPPVNQFGE
jgi:hypothetical protein